MLLKLRFITITFACSFALLLMLCLGAQNLSNRHALKIANATTAPLPSGFIVGISIVLGVISGGSIATLITSPDRS